MGIDKDGREITEAAELRRQAEEELKTKTAGSPPARTEAESQRLVHELQVHQIELEMQNEELHCARNAESIVLEKFTELYDFSPVGYCTLDREGIVLGVNLTGAALLNIERSRLIGRRIGMFVSNGDHNTFADFLGKVFTSMAKEVYEVKLQNEENTPLFMRIEAVASASGEECRVALLDITERKQAEEAIKRYTAILEGINGVLAAALACRTERDLGFACLEIAQKITQSKVGFIGEINEKGLEDIAISNPGWDACTTIGPGGHSRRGGNLKIHGIYGRVISEGKAMFTNDPANHPDRIGLPIGHPALDGFLGAPLIYEGRTIGMIAVANRPGGYTPVEQQTLEALAPAIVEALIRKRAEEYLSKAKEAAEAANRELESFSYSVSHDLRAPLRAIAGFAGILMEDFDSRLNDEGRGILSSIRKDTERMEKLIENLLTFAHIGRKEMEPTLVPMGELAGEVFEELKKAEAERVFRFTLSPLIQVMGDRDMLCQVFQNLLSNAIKYTRPREIAEIEVGCRCEGGENVYFVRDNGAGFDMKYSDKLFGVFQRLHGAKEFEGNGVGLAIVQQIVLRHGGRVWAESKKDEGATFYFTLPAGIVPVSNDDSGAQ